MTQQYTEENNVTISTPGDGSVPIVSQTEIEPIKTALSLMFALVTTTALTEPSPPQSRRVRAPRSLRLDVGRPDHLAPLFGFLGNVFAEVGGRAWKHSATKVGKARLHLGIVESRVDLLVELVDDFGRRGLRCAEAVPNTPLVARQELTHGRDVRQRFRARRCGYCERTQPASPDVFDHRGHGGERHLHLSTEQIGE